MPPPGWEKPFDVLRAKWGTIPLVGERRDSSSLLELPDEEVVRLWRERRDAGGGLELRGWYRLLYADFVRSRKILDIGCGFAFDSITFAEAGAGEVWLADIVRENVELCRRLGSLLGLSNLRFHYVEDVASLERLPDDFDAIMAFGSLHNAPQEVLKPEVEELARHLKPGGRWLQFAYPYSRWVREGSLPFDEWGPRVDGPGTPWEEWYDVPKLLDLLSPAQFELVFYCEWYDGNFNWIDLVKR